MLGLRRDTTWAEVRSAYRTRIRTVHPDVSRGPGTEAARLNAAFSTLERVYRRGEAPPPPATSSPSNPSPSTAAPTTEGRGRKRTFESPPPDLVLVADDGLVLEAPADEVFLRLAEALDDVGAVTYVDPNSGYLEALVGDGTGQLVVSLQGRAYATEAFFTLEQLDSRPAPPIESVVRAIAARLRAR